MPSEVTLEWSQDLLIKVEGKQDLLGPGLGWLQLASKKKMTSGAIFVEDQSLIQNMF